MEGNDNPPAQDAVRCPKCNGSGCYGSDYGPDFGNMANNSQCPVTKPYCMYFLESSYSGSGTPAEVRVTLSYDPVNYPSPFYTILLAQSMQITTLAT